MIIVIRHPFSGKVALYRNRYDSVAVAVYHLLKISPLDIHSHHLFPLVSFFKFLQASGYSISLEKCLPCSYINSVSIVFSHDLSSDSIRTVKEVRSAQPFVTSLLLLSEHPSYQKPLFTSSVLDMFDCVYTSMDLPHRNILPIFSSYIFREIPCADVPVGYVYGQASDVAIISSNLPNRRGTTYSLRRHMINVLSEIDSLSFIFHGRGWRLSDYSSNLRLLAKYSLSNLSHSTRITPRALLRYGGEVLDKNLLLTAKGCLSIENSLSPNGYITEKLIEPLVFGSIPVYMGPLASSKLLDILPHHFLRFFMHYDAPSMVKTCLEVSEMTLAQSKEISNDIRIAINSHLASNNFPTGLWKAAQFILDRLA